MSNPNRNELLADKLLWYSCPNRLCSGNSVIQPAAWREVGEASKGEGGSSAPGMNASMMS